MKIFTLLIAAVGITAAPVYACGKDGRSKTGVIQTRGDGGAHAIHGKCTSTPDVDVSEEQKDKDGKVARSHVLICNDGKAISAEIVERLEKTRADIARQDALSETMRDKVLAQLDAAIARHRATK